MWIHILMRPAPSFTRLSLAGLLAVALGVTIALALIGPGLLPGLAGIGEKPYTGPKLEIKKESTTTKPDTQKKMETITLGSGCFWCTEAVLDRVVGITSAVCGYSNGQMKNPTYEDICTGQTGHAEVVQVTYDPAVMPLEKLLEIFFDLHDPTTLNAQGVDTGTQYRSGIYFTTEDQKATAEKVKKALEKSGKFPRPIVTEIVKLDSYTAAEDYHQDYFDNNYTQGTGNYRYCQGIIMPKLKKLGLLKDKEK